MKRLDAAFYTVTGAAGELYSIRTDLFKPLPRPVVVDDLVISMQVCLQGYRIAYEPGACSTESSTGTLREESQRRIRIAAGVYGAMDSLNGLLNFFYLPPSGKNVDVFDAFEVDPHKQLAIIVRPDMHIGYMNDVADIGMMDNYLQNVAGIIPQK